MAKYKIEVDQNSCIGCGACAASCENFKLKEGKSQPKQEEVEELGCNQIAADSCPVHAIKITKLE
jgi:ferredoxin